MIRFACPVCGQKFQSEDCDAGHKYNCTACGQRIQIPPPSDTNKPPVGNKTVLGASISEPPRIVPVLELAEEGDYRCRAQRRSLRSFHCPECGSRAKRKQV